MYYQTTVKNLSDGYVIDTQGKRLQFVGNKFLNVGDKVWTDGKIIFGHTPLRSTPLLPNVESGIPVVGDDFKNCSRGYFTTTGIFKNKKIAEDTWISNDEKIYKHGKSQKVIDAEVGKNGLYTVSTENDGIYQEVNGKEIFLDSVTIKLDEKIIKSVTFKSLLEEKFEEKPSNALAKIQEISPQNYNLTAQIVSFKINRYGETEMILGSRAGGNLNTMELYSHEKYSREEFQAENFLWENSDTAVTQDPHLKQSLLMFWEYCAGCEIKNFEIFSWKIGEPSTDTKVADVEAEYLTHFKNDEVVELIEEKFSYPKVKHLSIETTEHDEKFNKILFGFRFRSADWRYDENNFISSYNYGPYIEINGELVPPVGDVTTYAVGWTAFFVGGESDGERIVATCPIGTAGEIDFVQPRDYVKNKTVPSPVMTYKKFNFGDSFVIGSDFIHYRFFAYENISEEIKNIFNRGEVYFFIMNDSNGKEHKVWLLRGDTNFSAIFDKKISEENFSDFYFPIQDGYTAKWRFDSEFQNLGIFDSFSEIYHAVPPYEKKFLYFESLPNLSICRLKKGHLLGFHNDSLYKIYGNNFEKVGEGLKNFRLREMKNLRGAI